MTEFEKWWRETYEEAFKNVGGALKASYKEVAKKAWDHGYSHGYSDGYANAEYHDGDYNG